MLWIAGGVLGIAGLWLAYWALLFDRAKGRKRCPKCWYDMHAAESLRCPECGHTAKTDRKLRKTRRRWRWALMSAVVIFGASFLASFPRVKREGWVAFIPSTVLILLVGRTETTWPLRALEPRLTEMPMLGRRTGVVVDNWERRRDALFAWQWELLSDRIHKVIDTEESIYWQREGIFSLERFELADPDKADLYVKWLDAQDAYRRAYTLVILRQESLSVLLNSPPVFAQVVATASSSDTDVRQFAIETLPYATNRADAVLSILVRILNNSEGRESAVACRALGKLTSRDDVVRPILLQKLNDTQYLYPDSAFGALMNLGTAAEELVLPLCESLQSQDARRVRFAVLYLRQVAAHAAEALLPLSELDLSKYKSLAGEQQSTLEYILQTAPEDATYAQCVQATRSPYSRARAWAATAVHRFESKREELLPVLDELLQDESPFVVMNAAKSIAEFRGEPKFQLPVLIPLLSHGNPRVRTEAADRIGSLGALAVEAIPALEAAVHDDDPEARDAVEHAIESIRLQLKSDSP